MALQGGCHCGRNRFEIDGDLPGQLTRCTCSFCRTHGNLIAYYQPGQFGMTNAASDAVYRWNSKQVAHHFCSACGCYMYADTPDFQPEGSWNKVSRRVGLNARLIDDFEAADYPVTVIDGKNLW